MKLKRSKEPEDVFIYDKVRRLRRDVIELLDALQKVSRSKNPSVDSRAVDGMAKVTEKYLRNIEEFTSVVDSNAPAKSDAKSDRG